MTKLFCECDVGNDDSPLYAWAAETLASLLPQLVRQEIMTAEAVGIESLEARLRGAVVAARSQFVGPEQFFAWASD